MKILELVDKSVSQLILFLIYSLHLSEQIRLYEHWKFLCARRGSDNRGSTVQSYYLLR